MALLQSATGTVSAGTSGTATLPNVTQSTSVIVVAFLEWQPSGSGFATTPTDNFGTTYTLQATGAVTASGNVAIYTAKPTSQGSLTVTFHASSATTAGFMVAEYSGLSRSTSNTICNDPPNANGGGSSSTGTATTAGTHTPVAYGALLLCITGNNSSGTYNDVGWTNSIPVTNGTLSAVLNSRTVPNPGAQTATNVQSVSAFWISQAFTAAGLPIQENNYQFVKVGNGMSVTEKIR